MHAPSALANLDEGGLVKCLESALDAKYSVADHADVIRNPSVWKRLGNLLLIENMDKRKDTGRSVAELRPILKSLPKARLCLDLALARRIDPSLCEIFSFLLEFGGRLGQLCFSELNSQSRHEPPSHAAVAAIRAVNRLIPCDTPTILEFPSSPDQLNSHLRFAQTMLMPEPVLVRNVV